MKDGNPETFIEGFKNYARLTAQIIFAIIISSLLAVAIGCFGMAIYLGLSAAWNASPLITSIVLLAVSTIPIVGVIGGVNSSRRSRQKPGSVPSIQRDNKSPVMWKVD
jgi:hypothetical protein